MINLNYFFLALFFTSVACLRAQTGLQFVQVQYLEVAGSGSIAVSVPAGKIWKVESVSQGSTGTAPSVLLRNASVQNVAFFSSPANGASASYPYWLPSGFSGSFVNNNLTYRCSISIVEYTVAP